jgi:nitrogen fixation protein NifU and related proteins
MYSAKVLDHFARPRHAREMANASAVVEAANPVCGDVLKLWVSVSNECVISASFKAAGCVPAVACGSWLAEWLQGKRISEAARLSAADIEAGLDGLPAASQHASALASEALRKALLKLQNTTNSAR